MIAHLLLAALTCTYTAAYGLRCDTPTTTAPAPPICSVTLAAGTLCTMPVIEETIPITFYRTIGDQFISGDEIRGVILIDRPKDRAFRGFRFASVLALADGRESCAPVPTLTYAGNREIVVDCPEQ